MSELKPCPFCGESVYIEKKPLWLTHNDGTTVGYFGCYMYEIRCHNCGCNVPAKDNDTVYYDDKTAKENAIKAWNRRADTPHKCGDCEDFHVCEEYVDADETFPEVGGCPAFIAKKGETK